MGLLSIELFALSSFVLSFLRSIEFLDFSSGLLDLLLFLFVLGDSDLIGLLIFFLSGLLALDLFGDLLRLLVFRRGLRVLRLETSVLRLLGLSFRLREGERL